MAGLGTQETVAPNDICLAYDNFLILYLPRIELMHMIRKGQMITAEGCDLSFADQFYALAA